MLNSHENQCIAYAYIEIGGNIDVDVFCKIIRFEPRKVYIKGSIGRFGRIINQNSISFSTSKINTLYSYEVISRLIDILPIDDLKAHLSELNDVSVDVVVVFNFKGLRPAVSIKNTQINWLSSLQSSFSVSMYEDLE